MNSKQMLKTKIRRFDSPLYSMFEHPNKGDYVLYSDYLLLKEDLEVNKKMLSHQCDLAREAEINTIKGQRAIEKLEKLQELYANNASHYAGTNDIAYKTHKILAEDN